MNKIVSHYILCFVLLFCLLQPQIALADEELEYKIKAAIIRKFPAFVSWPAEVSPLNTHRVDICLLGESAIVQQRGTFEKHDDKATVVYNFNKIGSPGEAAGRCHIVFIGQSEAYHLVEVITKLSSSPVLTVSDIDNFAQNGGMIGFQLIDNKVRYNVNNPAFGKANLKVDAQLLEIANVVIQ